MSTATNQPTLRVRRCRGNRNAWILTRLRPDGSEVESNGASVTAMSIDALLRNAGRLTPTADDRIELLTA